MRKCVLLMLCAFDRATWAPGGCWGDVGKSWPMSHSGDLKHLPCASQSGLQSGLWNPWLDGLLVSLVTWQTPQPRPSQNSHLCGRIRCLRLISRDKEDVVHIHNGILLSHEKEWNNGICSNRDGPRNYHAVWSQSDNETPTSNAITYMWNLKKGNMNFFADQILTYRLWRIYD